MATALSPEADAARAVHQPSLQIFYKRYQTGNELSCPYIQSIQASGENPPIAQAAEGRRRAPNRLSRRRQAKSLQSLKPPKAGEEPPIA